MTTWVLPTQILALSEAKTWAEAVREWHLDGIEILDGGEFSTCLCGHWPIRELCHISNPNGNQAIIGNHCITRFEKDDPGHEAFGSVPRALQAAERILANPSASANEDLIHLARQQHVLSDENARFYLDIHKKRNLTPKQEAYKGNLNRQLLYGLVLSVRKAYQLLKENPAEKTAGPKLVQFAFDRGVLDERDRAFYLQNWDKAHNVLTEKQRNYRAGLNRRMVDRLKGVLDSSSQ